MKKYGYFCAGCGNTAEVAVDCADEIALAVLCGCGELPDVITARTIEAVVSMDSVEVPS